MSIAVTQRGFEPSRSNTNLQETVFTQASVRQQGIRRLFTIPLYGDGRGTEATTLIAPGIRTRDGQTRDLVIHGIMSDYVEAHDADTGQPVWRQCLGVAIPGSKAIDTYLINDHWGFLSTGILDLADGAWGGVSWSSPDGSVAKAAFWFHWISIVDGSPLAPPLSLEGAVYNPGGGIASQKFSSAARKQRCGLAMATIGGAKTVFIAAGSVSESLASNRGWVVAVDVTAKGATKVAAAWSSTARYSGAGIWMGAQAPAVLGNKLYLMTGNGAFDPPTDLGECLVELQYDPSTAGAPARLHATDWFAPFSDAARNGDDPTLPQPLPKAGGQSGEGGDGDASNTDAFADMDLGSGGLGIIPELGCALGAGKDGIVYVLRLGAFGKTRNADLAPAKIAGNYAKAKYIGWFTFFPGFGISPSPTDMTTLNKLFDGKTHHQHSTPVAYKSPVHGWMVFCWGENSSLRAWKVNADLTLAFLASSDETASPNTGGTGGMPGGMISLSANGAAAGSAVLWASVPYGNANSEITNGRLLAYDPENFAARGDGSLRIQKLWDSQDWGLAYVFNKFLPPTPANGRVYLANYAGGVDVYGP
jgi:hypothetical protein